jgi:insulysin
LGTEKYPKEGEYMDYLSKNSGLYNAYTSLMETNYFFECSNQAFQEGLDRFAQFFISPLFLETCVDREMNAVNSEHTLYLKQDMWREF